MLRFAATHRFDTALCAYRECESLIAAAANHDHNHGWTRFFHHMTGHHGRVLAFAVAVQEEVVHAHHYGFRERIDALNSICTGFCRALQLGTVDKIHRPPGAFLFRTKRQPK